MNQGSAEDVADMAEVFASVARVLLSEHEMEGALDRIVHLAVEHLESADFAGISFVERGGRISSPASSNDIPRQLDALQEELGEGPCLDAISEHEVFQTDDLTSEERWPQFSQRAHEETGVTSILSMRLFAEAETMGALNLYATAPRAFDDDDVALAAVFATHAAVAMSAARREEHLEQKAESRDVIGQAKGILMAREHVSEEAAFDRLRKASQRLNVKLATVAADVAYRGHLEVPPEGSRSN